jgi:hypothetical protein
MNNIYPLLTKLSAGSGCLAALIVGNPIQAATGSPPPETTTPYQFTIVNLPGNVNNFFFSDTGLGSGTFTDSTGNSHGYLWNKGGVTIVDAPNSTFTYLNGHNNTGVAIGGFGNPNSSHWGLYNVHKGSWTSLPEIPGMPFGGGGGINNQGLCVGVAFESDGRNGVGWLWDGKSYSFFDVPQASSAAFAGTQPQGINDLGQVTGIYIDDAGLPHGFLKEGSEITTFDVPGADFTAPVGINNEGDIAGFYGIFATNLTTAFLLHKGQFYTITLENSTTAGLSDVTENGAISGGYQDAAGTWHGIIGTPHR